MYLTRKCSSNLSRYFPLRTELHTYINAVASTLNVVYNTTVTSFETGSEGPCAVLEGGERQCARRIFVGTGLQPNVRPDLEELGVISYTDFRVSMAMDEKVCILGNGNAAWEVAQASFETARAVTMVARRPTRWSFLTKYTGDVRIKYAQVCLPPLGA